MTPESTLARSLRTARRVALVAAAATAAVLVLRFGGEAGSVVVRFAGGLDRFGAWGPLIFVLGYVVATVAFLPGSLLTLAAGVLFGLGTGTLVVFVGAVGGSSAAFLVARHLARSRVERWVSEDVRFEAIDRAIAREGGKVVFLLRLSPLFPFTLLNYVLGLTRVRFRDYVLASLGMLPGTFLYVYLGKGLGDLAALSERSSVDTGPGGWTLLVLGLVATVAVTWLVTSRARAALREVADV